MSTREGEEETKVGFHEEVDRRRKEAKEKLEAATRELEAKQAKEQAAQWRLGGNQILEPPPMPQPWRALGEALQQLTDAGVEFEISMKIDSPRKY